MYTHPPMKKPKTGVFATLTFLLLGVACSQNERPATNESMERAEESVDASPDGARSSERTNGGASTGETVVLDGTPEIPDQLRDRLRQYLNTRSAWIESLSDDGTTVLISTRFAETSQLHLLSQPGGSRRQVTFNDEPIRSGELLPGNNRSLVYVSDVGGAEVYQLFRLDLETGRTTRLSDGSSRHISLVPSRDGSRIAYSNNARNGRDMDLYLGDGVSHNAEERLLEREGHWYPIEFSPDGQKLLIGHYVSINESHLFEVDFASRETTRLTPETPTASYRDATYGADGRTLFVTTDREGEFIELYETQIGEEGAWRPLSRSIPWNVEQIALSHDGQTLAFTTNEDGTSVLRMLDTRARQLREPGVEVPNGVIRGLHFARAARVLGFTVTTPQQTGDVYSIDLARRSLSRWTESEIGGLNPESFVEPTLVRYRTFDDREIPAFYYRPRQEEGDGGAPVLVYIHGGPESQSRPYFSSLIQYLVLESRIAVLVPNVRGSDGYGKSYLLLDNGEQREDSVRDIGALLDWVSAQQELDDEHVAVYGGSYGGYMVLASLAHFGDRLRAGVDIVGISSFVTFLENTQEYRRDLRRQEYGDERDPDMRRHLESISPVNTVDRIRSALFVAHGANDPRVPLGETEQIVDAVRSGGNPVWTMVARNEGHGFRRKENRDLFIQLTVLFLEEHLRLSQER